MVQVKCDYCGKIYTTQYSTYLKTKRNDKNACVSCGHILAKETNLKKYGVENVFSSPEIQNKIKETLKEKYGVTNISQSSEIQEKIKNNNLEKYGVTNTSKLNSVKQKVIESNREKFGVDYPMQTKEFQEQIRKTSKEKYGVEHHTQAPEVIAKKQATLLKNYGVINPTQNKNILNKSIKTRYSHGNFTCSKQQYQLYQLIGGELNYPFQNFVLDIAYPEDKIAMEWDGSGHDLSVRLGKMTQQEFNRNENFRMKSLFINEWKIIRLITKKDKFPKNIKKIMAFCFDYIKNGGHYISVFIEEEEIHYKNQVVNFNSI